jgi:uncharacterized damage-inducible protein DinB
MRHPFRGPRALTTPRPALLAAACAATLIVAAPAAAQQHGHEHAHHHPAAPAEGLRAELIQGLNGVGEKYLSLFDALGPHLDWRPGEGVRSTRELFAHVAAGNFMIANMAGVDLPGSVTMADVRAMGSLTDAAEIRRQLDHSFRHLAHGIAGTSDDTLDDPTTLFGRETTRRGVLLLLATHAHEHLGQAIAYARVNGVAPPWSAAAN